MTTVLDMVGGPPSTSLFFLRESHLFFKYIAVPMFSPQEGRPHLDLHLSLISPRVILSFVTDLTLDHRFQVR